MEEARDMEKRVVVTPSRERVIRYEITEFSTNWCVRKQWELFIQVRRH